MSAVSPEKGNSAFFLSEKDKVPSGDIYAEMESTWVLLLSLPISPCCRFSLTCILCCYCAAVELCCSFSLPSAFVPIACQGIIVPIIESVNCHDIFFVYFQAPCNHQCWCFNRQSAFPSSFSHYHRSSCSCSRFINHMVQSRRLIQLKGLFEDVRWISKKEKWGFCPNLFRHLWKSTA